MAENHEIRISVDARQADQGLRVLDTALARSSENLNKFDQRARQTFDNLDKAAKGADFARLSREVASISSAGSSMAAQMNAAGRSVSNTFNQMSSAARSAQQAFNFGSVAATGRNLQAFARIIQQVTAQIRGLGGVNLPSGLAATIHALGTSLATFRAPSQQTMVRLQMFFQQLSSMRINGGAAGALAQLGAATSSFRTISAASVNNMLRLLSGLSTANSGQINSTITALSRLNGLAFNIPGNVGARLTALQNQINQLRNGGGGAGGGGGGGGLLPGLAGFTGRLRNATSGILGMQNAMNGMYQISTLLRTAMGAITLGSFVSGIFDAGTNMQAFQRKMEAVSPTVEEAQNQIGFLAEITKTLPIPLAQAQKSFSNFAASARLSGQSVGDIQEMFKGIGTASAVFKLKPEAFENVMVAFEQMFNKGQVMSEELKRQLGQYLPAAVEVFAFSMGKTTKEFTKMMQNGQVGSENVKQFIATYAQIFGPMLQASMVSARNQMTLFQNSFTALQIKVSDSGFDVGMATLFNRLSQILESPTFIGIAERIGKGFNEMFISLGALASVAANHADELLKLGSAALGIAVAFTGLKIAVSLLTSPLLLMAGAAYLAYTYFGEMDGGMTSLIPKFDSTGAGFATVAAAGVAAIVVLGKVTSAVGGLRNAMVLGAAAGIAYGGHVLGNAIGKSMADWVDANPEKAKELGAASGNMWTFAARIGVEQAKEWWAGEGTKGIADSTKPAQKIAEDSGESIFDRMGTAMQTGVGKLKGLITNATGEITAEFNRNKQALTAWDLDAEFLKGSGKAAEELLKKIYHDVGYAQDTKVDDIKKALQRKLDPIGVAIDEYKAESKKIEDLNKAFHVAKEKYGVEGVGVDDDMKKKMQDRLDYVTLKARNPIQASVRDMKEEFAVLAETGDKRQIESQLLQMKNKLMSEGYQISTQELDVMRNMLLVRQDLERGGANGFQRWASGVKDLRESLIDVEKNGVDKLSDALADLSVGAEVNFQKIGLSMLRMFNKAIIDDLMKQVLSSFKGNSPLASIFGLKAPDANSAINAADSMAEESSKKLISQATATMSVQAGTVNVFGAGGSTGGFGAVPNGPQVQSYGDQNGLFPNAGQTLNDRAPGTPGARMDQLPAYGPGSGMSSITPDGLTAFANAGSPLSGASPATAVATGGGAAQAVDLAKTMFGKTETTNNAEVNSFLKAGGINMDAAKEAWCAGFVNSSLEQVGIKGNGSKVANSFQNFGSGVDFNDIQKGDILLQTNGKGLNQVGGHVGFATGNSRIGPDGQKQFEMLAGNQGDAVSSKFVSQSQDLMVRRAAAASPTSPFANVAAPTGTGDAASRVAAEAELGKKFEDAGMGDQWKSLQNKEVMQMNQFELETGFKPGKSFVGDSGIFAPGDQKDYGGLAFAGGQTGSGFGGAPAESLAPATTELQSFGSEINSVGAAAGQSVPQFNALGDGLSSLFAKMGSNGGGGAGFLGMFGGGGAAAAPEAGAFSEGGLSTSPVASYASGTEMARRSAGTSAANGGFPAILHDNEAVIPLTRGREVPVQISKDDTNGPSAGSTIVVHMHGVKDFDSFKKSGAQMKSQLHSAAILASQKNN